MKNLIFFAIILFGCYSSTVAQVQQEWMKRFAASRGLPGSSKFIAVDDSSNVIVAGVSVTTLSQRGEMCVTKYNAQGDSLWTSVFEEPGSYNSDDITGLAIDKEQDIIITGYTHKPPERDDDLFITTIKYNHVSGQKMYFERNINPDPDASDRAIDIAMSNNNIYITGNVWHGTFSNGGTGMDMVVFSYMPNGSNSMVYQWADSSASSGSSICVGNSGQVYALGSGSKSGKSILRLVTVGGDFNDYILPDTYWGISFFPKMVLDSEENRIIISQCMGNASYLDNKLLLLKYTGGNQPSWVKIIDAYGSTNSIFYDLLVDHSNNILLAGGIRLSNGNYKNFIKKFSPSGDSIWTVFPPAVNYKLACKIAVDKYNSVYTTGNLNGMIAIKYDQDGKEAWRGSPGIQFWKSDIVVDSLLNVYVTGERWMDWPGDYCTVKYGQTNLNGTHDLAPVESFQLFQNYPNPLFKTTTIRWQSAKSSWQTLKVYNMFGNEVATLVDELRPAGRQSINFNSEGLSAGVYFYQLRADGVFYTNKMIICE